MYTTGIFLFIAATLILFGSDIMVKRGKIKDIKDHLKMKTAGLSLLFIGLLLMLLNKN